MQPVRVVESINKVLGQISKNPRLRSGDGKFRSHAHKGEVSVSYNMPRKVKNIIERHKGKAKQQATGGAFVAVFEAHDDALSARRELMENGYRVVQHDVPGVIFITAGKGITESASSVSPVPAGRVWRVTGKGDEGHFIVECVSDFAVVYRSVVEGVVTDSTLCRGDIQAASAAADAIVSAQERSAHSCHGIHLVQNERGTLSSRRFVTAESLPVQVFRRGTVVSSIVECHAEQSPSCVVKIHDASVASAFDAENVLRKHAGDFASIRPAGHVSDDQGGWHTFAADNVDAAQLHQRLDVAHVKHRIHSNAVFESSEVANWIHSPDSVFANRIERNRTPDVIDRSLSSLIPGKKKYKAQIEHDTKHGTTAITVPLQHVGDAINRVSDALARHGLHDAEIRQHGGQRPDDYPRNMTFHVLHHVDVSTRGEPRLFRDSPMRRIKRASGKALSAASAKTLQLVKRLHAVTQSLGESGMSGESDRGAEFLSKHYGRHHGLNADWSPRTWTVRGSRFLSHAGDEGHHIHDNEDGTFTLAHSLSPHGEGENISQDELFTGSAESCHHVAGLVKDAIKQSSEHGHAFLVRGLGSESQRPDAGQFYVSQRVIPGHRVIQTFDHGKVVSHNGEDLHEDAAQDAKEIAVSRKLARLRAMAKAGHKDAHDLLVKYALAARADFVRDAHAAARVAGFKLKEDQLPGGKGDGRSIKDFDPDEVEMGRKVEREHSDDPAIIDEILSDHLSEDPHYYTKLARAGLADELRSEK